LFGIETPPPRIEAVRVVDMSASNAWAEFAAQFSPPRPLVTLPMKLAMVHATQRNCEFV
jgi:hypothetical protein